MTSKDEEGCLGLIAMLVLLLVLMTCCSRLGEIRDRLPLPVEKG